MVYNDVGDACNSYAKLETAITQMPDAVKLQMSSRTKALELRIYVREGLSGYCVRVEIMVYGMGWSYG